MSLIIRVFTLLFFCSAFALAQGRHGVLGDSNLRGVSAVDRQVVWVSGSKGAIARTTDGGKSWQRLAPPSGAEAFDFRDIEAFDANTAYLMSSGPAEQSRIWKTTDGGKSWQQQYTNPSPDFFLDSLACWDAKQCIALSDPVDGKFLVLMITDGEHWRELPRDRMPAALVDKRTMKDGKQEELKEGAFAASGTAITVFGRHIWFGTGGPKARVFHSGDRGETWTVAETPIVHGEATQGIFSIAFRDAQHGMIVGGDYKQPDKTGANAAFTNDGGKTWKLFAPDLPYCSAVRLDPVATHAIAVGLRGVFDISATEHSQVHRIDERVFNAISTSWLGGPDGAVVHPIPLPK